MIECLPSMRKALEPMPNATKEKKMQTYVFKTVNATLVRFGLTMMTVLLKINLSRKAGGGGGQGLLLMALCASLLSSSLASGTDGMAPA